MIRPLEAGAAPAASAPHAINTRRHCCPQARCWWQEEEHEASTSAELYDPATGSWSSTGSLGTERSDHTATLLPSGKVLVAGGSGAGHLSSAECMIRRREAGAAPAASAPHALSHGDAAALRQGAGGGGNSGSWHLSSAELYDPATGSWSSTGSLGTARSAHTATLLPSGKVLVAGGYNEMATLSSAELYDPATGSWSSTGNLGTARARHTATLLPSGKVLVAGGDGSNSCCLEQRGTL